MLPVFYVLGVAVYQVYYLSFEKRGQDALRGLAFFFGLLFITEVVLILLFGVDYRYVEAAYIGPTMRLAFVDLPLRMLVPCVVSLLLLSAAALLTHTFIGRAIMAVAQDQLALQLMAANPIRIKRIAFAVSIATASLAGAFLIIIQPVEPSVGREYIGRVLPFACSEAWAAYRARSLPRCCSALSKALPPPSTALVGAGDCLRVLAFDAGDPAGRHPRAVAHAVLAFFLHRPVDRRHRLRLGLVAAQ